MTLHRMANERGRMVEHLTEILGRSPSSDEVDLALQVGVAKMRSSLRQNFARVKSEERRLKGGIFAAVGDTFRIMRLRGNETLH